MPMPSGAGIARRRGAVKTLLRMKILKRTSFGLLGLLLAVLVTATVVEKRCGTAFVAEHVYRSAGFVALWGVSALAAGVYVVRRRLYRRPAAFMLHAAFGVILAGAFVTWATGERGTLHLRADEAGRASFVDDEGGIRPLPFAVALQEFRIEYYPGTRAPMDFVSRIRLRDEERTIEREVAMNRVAEYRHYRFYQSAYDADGGGTTLSVAHDAWGIGITYAGYLLLWLSMIASFFDRRSAFRRLLRHPALRRMSLVLLLASGASAVRAAGALPTLPRATADEMGRLYVYYNDRICPLSTLAREWTTKLCGRSRYAGRTPEQVVAGWLFYYDEWKNEPMLRVGGGRVRRLLGIEGRYARLTDFGRAFDEGRRRDDADRGVAEADEKFNLVAMLCTGSMLKLFPYVDPGDGALHWASQVDDLPAALPADEALFIRRSMNYVNELVVRRDYAELERVLHKIRDYQRRTCGDALPSDLRIAAERLYGRSGTSRPAAVALLVAGMAGFAAVCRCTVRGRRLSRNLRRAFDVGLWLGFVYLTFALALRGYAAGHWPLANGFETMQFMAWCVIALTLWSGRRFPPLVPFGCLIAGAAMLVSTMGESNPRITPLMPVLASPLLSIHVVLVMAAYALLALLMCNGAAGLVSLRRRPSAAVQLQVVGRLLLYPAVCCLAAGIFVGAVWADVSWGRYWGWDPKEVWALVTLLVYALALHPASLPAFRRPGFFHAFCVAAFLCVLITYFGVNFLLGGMHAYA